MDKRRVVHIIKWGVAIAACAWLVWKLATYEDYAALGESLRNMGWQQWVAIGLCIALMPVNMAIEAWRWMTLMGEGMSELESERIKGLEDERIRGLTFSEAQRQVYYSKLAGLITPWRLGEYPARGLLLTNERMNELGSERIWPKVLSMGAVGSATMTGTIVAAGAVALIFEIGDWKWEKGYIYLVGAVLVLLTIALVFAPRLLKRYADVSHKLIVLSLGQSLVRLACWCVQLALVLWALDGLVDEGISGLVANTFVYYLLVTITPNVPVVEAGVRGAWAMMVFGTANAALAGVLLWGINTLLPCVAGLFLSKKRQKLA